MIKHKSQKQGDPVGGLSNRVARSGQTDPSIAEDFREDLPPGLTRDQIAKCEVYLEWSIQNCNSYTRLPAILAARLPRDVFFACLGVEWPACDNFADFATELKARFLRATRRQLNLMMTGKEMEQWEELPDSITAYRFAYDNNLIGFSYSLKREVAERFSTYRRYRQSGKDRAYIVKAAIPKRYSVLELERNEHEIILTRPQAVTYPWPKENEVLGWKTPVKSEIR